MPRKFYTRGWHHTKTRGRETIVICGYCGKKFPKYKAFTAYKGFRINDPALKKEINRKFSLSSRKMYVCPACARFHKIVQKKR